MKSCNFMVLRPYLICKDKSPTFTLLTLLKTEFQSYQKPTNNVKVKDHQEMAGISDHDVFHIFVVSVIHM